MSDLIISQYIIYIYICIGSDILHSSLHVMYAFEFYYCVRAMKCKRIRWAAHVCKAGGGGEIRNWFEQATVQTPVGKRSVRCLVLSRLRGWEVD
jgi:hypothetical protein